MTTTPSYVLGYDGKYDVLRLSIRGHFDPAVLLSLKQNLDDVLVRWDAESVGGERRAVLVDFRKHVLQSQDIAAQASALMSAYDLKGARVAVLLPSSVLHSMQLKRIAPTDFKLFTIEQDALQWLAGGRTV
ncbi:hypothetical protein [Sphingomonas sp. GB1N7]|uniref:hypothetical protein n=1 Tax=Parasphingomonas caseinilytica TaxID=3096158 RepID=UPI002FCB125E